MKLILKGLSGLLLFFITGTTSGQTDMTREEYLQQLLKVLPEARYNSPSDPIPGQSVIPAPHVSPEDFTWRDWLKRSGELPPDFDEMPSIPFLPDPLILDEGGKEHSGKNTGAVE